MSLSDDDAIHELHKPVQSRDGAPDSIPGTILGSSDTRSEVGSVLFWTFFINGFCDNSSSRKSALFMSSKTKGTQEFSEALNNLYVSWMFK